jgi:oxygen-independent coproporphyrinogen-3 oxidase
MTALYIHWPFCVSKCPYCDFNSHVAEKINHDDWILAYSAAFAAYEEWFSTREITSIFFGGGTPSLMPPKLVEKIITDISRIGKISADCEITLEANPSSVERKKFQEFAAAGVNRLSIGVQSLRDDALQFFGRPHSADDARAAISQAMACFPRVSVDLIYARPSQKWSEWQAELEEILAFNLSHISLYQLTIERGTAFFAAFKKGVFKEMPDNQAADFYAKTVQFIEAAGFSFYEVSNAAKTKQESRHNLAYWNYEEYLGIGPGAHSRIIENKKRFSLMHWYAPERWCLAAQSKNIAEMEQKREEISFAEQKEEALLMGLRLRGGIKNSRWQKLFSNSLAEDFPPLLTQKFIDEKLLLLDQNGMRATEKGRMVLNELILQLLA